MLINMFSCICMLKQDLIHSFIDLNERKLKKIQFEFFVNKSSKIHNAKIFAVEHSAWRHMKENYQIYLPYQFCPRMQSVDGDAQLPDKKMKILFFWNMSKS